MKNDWSGQSLPHPEGRRPVLGDVGGVDRDHPVQDIVRRGDRLGPLFEMRVFSQRFVFVGGARLAAEMCDESRFHKGHSPAVESLRAFAGDGLFTAYNHEPNWRLAHDVLMPAFTREAMQRYHPTMLQTLRELFAMWDAHEGPVDVSSGMTKLTMETLSRAAFDRDFGSLTEDAPHPFIPAMVSMLSTAQRLGSLAAMPGSRVLANRLLRQNRPHMRYIDELLDGVIDDRRALGSAGAGDDLLGLMLSTRHPETGARLDDLNIRRQMLTFLVAGHETTSGALSLATYYLATHPDVLARAQAETDVILGPDPDAEPTFEQIPKLRYLRRVLDETLRLWPTAPAFTRSPRQEIVLSTGHRMRPADWAIVVIPLMHRDREIWGDDPEAFDPDRFLPEQSRARPPHVYKPFGTGERSCIGRQFALHESILALARMLHRYDVAADPDYELHITERLTLMPEGFELTLTPRTPALITSSTDRTSTGAPS